MALTLPQVGNILLILTAIASAAAWIWVVRRRATTGQPLVEPRAQREPFWSLAEFFVCFGLSLVCSAAALLTVQRFQAAPSASGVAVDSEHLSTVSEELSATSEGLAALQLASSIASALVLASMLVWMGLTRRKFFERYGLWPSWGDLRLGLVASLFILPPVLLVATLLDLLIKYEHPVLDAVAAEPTLSVFLAMTFSAAIVTPLLEEFMFRALLQGGAQKIARRLVIAQQATGADKDRPEISEMISGSEVATWTWWPVMISSAAFALMHIGQGAAPIALFLFAVAVGYLYRQTGRLWPCIMVHFVLNAFTMIVLGLHVALKSS